jgi:hypothetical protein
VTSRRDYIATSAILRASKLSRKQREELAAHFADYFERDNPHFDRARFLEAADATDWAFLGEFDERGQVHSVLVPLEILDPTVDKSVALRGPKCLIRRQFTPYSLHSRYLIPRSVSTP